MCIAIYKPKGKPLSKRILKQCFRNNPNGAGFMYALDGRIYISKGFNKFKAFWKAYHRISQLIEDTTDIILHFRIATSGIIDTKNCHPHKMKGGIAFVHNGILSIDVPKKSKVSDTIIFRDKILNKLPDGWMKNPAILELITKYIDISKFIFLDRAGKVLILNESDGILDDGVWFSNTTYKETPRYTNWEMEDWLHEKQTDCGEIDKSNPDGFGLCGTCREPLIEDHEQAEGFCDSCLRKLYGFEYGQIYHH